MANVAKYLPINERTSLITEIKSHFQMFRTKKIVAFASYGFMFSFIAFTIFLAFSPSTNSYSPWFTNIFSTISNSGTISSSSSDDSIYSYFFPNSTTMHQVPPSNSTNSSSEESKNSTTQQQPNLVKGSSNFKNQTQNSELIDKGGIFKPNKSSVLVPKSPLYTNQTVNVNKDSSDVKKQTAIKDLHDKDKGEILKTKQSSKGVENSPVKANQTANSSPKSLSSEKNATDNGKTRIAEKGIVRNHGNGWNSSGSARKQTPSKDLHDKDKGEILKTKQSSKGVENSPVKANQTANSSPKSLSSEKNATDNGKTRIAEKGIVRNHGNGWNSSGSARQGIDILVKSLVGCEFFDGNWVIDNSYPIYKPGSCSLIDEQFNCFVNGRPDNAYTKMKWKPKGCTLPRLDASHMLDMLRRKRLVFVGDSLNRNMWESLICILKKSVKDQKKVYESFGRQHFRAEAIYSFVFEDYNCTVEFFASPFLVRAWEVKDKNGKKKETLRLDMIAETALGYETADIIVFNTGHWWTHEKTSIGKDYYQEGSHVYSYLNVLEAFRKALTTWGRWVDAHINPTKTLVFFRGYSVSHFSGGQWNSGGACDNETEPIENEKYLAHYPDKMVVLERVLKGMKTPVSYLNVTRMTDYRKDGHPSIYRKQSYSAEEKKSPLKFQDYGHWCLPGVPDAWNEILYAELLVNQYKKQQQQQQQK